MRVTALRKLGYLPAITATFLSAVAVVGAIASCGSRRGFVESSMSSEDSGGGAFSEGAVATPDGSSCEQAAAAGTNSGCEFYAIPPYISAFGQQKYTCLAAFVVNSGDSPITLEVEYDNVKLDPATMGRLPSGSGTSLRYDPLAGGVIPKDRVAILFLAGTTSGCPKGVEPGILSKTDRTDPAVFGTGRGKAFRLRSNHPVAAYTIYPYGGGGSAITSASLLLPTSTWSKDYVGVVPNEPPTNSSAWLAIVAMEDDTSVVVRSKIGIDGTPDVAALIAGSPGTYRLRRAEVLQFLDTNRREAPSLTGTFIGSDRPIAVFGGSPCFATRGQACDGAHQQLPPVSALGSEYAVVRHKDRFAGLADTPPHKLVGAVNDTRLTYLPTRPVGAPEKISAGEVVEFETSDVYVVRSQDPGHPFYVASMMHSCGYRELGELPPDCRGDPEFVSVIPTDQYQRRYVFVTDPTYPETNLIAVRKREDGAFSDVVLDCAGPLTGWIAIDETYQFARVDLVTGNFAQVGKCDNGVHAIESAASFGIVVWGWGSLATGGVDPGDPRYTQFVSYAYPGGAGARKLNDVVLR